MLLRPGALPTGDGWAFELKWDGFRAIVSAGDGLRVRSRRGWNMSDRLPELAALPEQPELRRLDPPLRGSCKRSRSGCSCAPTWSRSTCRGQAHSRRRVGVAIIDSL